MKNLFLIISVVTLFACTKSSDSAKPNYIIYSDSLRVLEDIRLMAAITKASPYDSANNPSADTVQLTFNRFAGSPDYLQNYNVSLSFSSDFSFGIYPQILLIDYKMIPGAGGKVEINKVYENTYTGEYLTQPLFLSMHSGTGIGVGKYFLSQDSIPTDGTGDPQVKIYCKLVFTKDYVVQRSNGDLANIVDGKISGYYEAHFGSFDYDKYVSSFNYECDFKGVVLDK